MVDNLLTETKHSFNKKDQDVCSKSSKARRLYFDAIITFDDQTAVFMLIAKSSEISLKCDTVNNRH